MNRAGGGKMNTTEWCKMNRTGLIGVKLMGFDKFEFLAYLWLHSLDCEPLNLIQVVLPLRQSSQ